MTAAEPERAKQAASQLQADKQDQMGRNESVKGLRSAATVAPKVGLD